MLRVQNACQVIAMNRRCTILAAIIALSGSAAAAETLTLAPADALRLGSALNYLAMCEVQGFVSSGRVPSHSRALKQRYQTHWPTIVSAFKESTLRSLEHDILGY